MLAESGDGHAPKYAMMNRPTRDDIYVIYDGVAPIRPSRAASPMAPAMAFIYFIHAEICFI